VIPPKANRKAKRDCDFVLYCERNLVERFFNKIKHYRAIATRYDKLARNFLAAVQLVAAIILLKLRTGPSRAISKFESYAGHSGAPRSGEPGIHNHWPRAMDSGLATFGGAPE